MTTRAACIVPAAPERENPREEERTVTYVVIGTRGVVTFQKGFACTREELPREIRGHADYVAREAGMGGIGMVLKVEEYESREAATLVANCYRDGTLTVEAGDQ